MPKKNSINNHFNQHQNVMYGQDFFIRLNLLNKDGIILYDSTRIARVALSRELLDMICQILTFEAIENIEELHQFFNAYILNWNNDFSPNNDPGVMGEIAEFHNEFVNGLMYYENSRQTIENFLLTQSSQTVGAYFVLDRVVSSWGFQLEPWYDQINLDSC